MLRSTDPAVRRWLRVAFAACVGVVFVACNLNPRPESSQVDQGNEPPGLGGGGSGGRTNNGGGSAGLPSASSGGSFTSTGGSGAAGPLPTADGGPGAGRDAATDNVDGGGDAGDPDAGDPDAGDPDAGL